METRAAYIARVVSEAPPLSNEQIGLIAMAFFPEAPRDTTREPDAARLERERKEQEREEAMNAAKNLALSMTACDVCGLQPDVHQFQRNYGTFHDWEPGRAEKLMKR